jgi:ParB-like chromosome segregation protein Spo0J
MPVKLDLTTSNKARKIAIDEINVSQAVQIRTRLRQDAIKTYTEIFDQLPPIDLYDIAKHGLVLADGWHRLEAAKRLNRTHVFAVVRKGTLNDAMAWAVIANMKHGQPLTRQERYDGVLRMKRLHKAWRNHQIAKAMGISDSSVGYMLREAQVRHELKDTPKVTRQSVRYLSSLPKKFWEPMLKAAEKRNWSTEEMRMAAHNIKSPKVPQEHKDLLLAGEADPVVINRAGEPGYLPETVMRLVRKEVKDDPSVAILKMEEALTRVRTFPIDKIVEAIDREHADRVLREYPSFVSTLDKIYAEVKASTFQPHQLREVN